jgi:hypothetical protein
MVIPRRSLEECLAVIAMVSCLVFIEMSHGHMAIPTGPFALLKRAENLQSFYPLLPKTLTVQNLGGQMKV